MAELMVEVDGAIVPLAGCDWVFYGPCGCPFGVTLAAHGDMVLHDDETAWRSFYDAGRKRDTDTVIKRARARGVTAVLVTRERYRTDVVPLMGARCQHPASALREASDALF